MEKLFSNEAIVQFSLPIFLPELMSSRLGDNNIVSKLGIPFIGADQPPFKIGKKLLWNLKLGFCRYKRIKHFIYLKRFKFCH
jgi:hypothetical protein